MLVGIPPFYNSNWNLLFEQIKGYSPNIPNYLSKSTIDILKRLLDKTPKTRLGTKFGAKEVKEHPWFKGIDWDDLYNKEYLPLYKP